MTAQTIAALQAFITAVQNQAKANYQPDNLDTAATAAIAALAAEVPQS